MFIARPTVTVIVTRSIIDFLNNSLLVFGQYTKEFAPPQKKKQWA